VEIRARETGWVVEVIDADPTAWDNDLPYTGNTFAAASGARLRDLMARMGHDSERAAMIYRHEARGADQRSTPTSRQREPVAPGRPAVTCKEAAGAGDENRTRTISLGSAATTAASDADLRV